MSKPSSSQAQHEDPTTGGSGGAKNPLEIGLEAWSRLANEHIGRVQAFYDELAGFESAAYDRAKKAADEMADMMSGSVTYMTRLIAEWRELSLEATKRGAAMFGARA